MVEGHNLGQDSSAAGEEWMEREREFMNAPLCARFISAPDCLRQESSYPNCVGETSKGS